MTVAKNIKSSVANLITLALVSVASLFIVNWGLYLFGFPSRLPVKIAHPANFSEIRETSEFKYVFSTNDMGLRYRQIPLDNNTGEYRVFVVGDSFTEGVGVNEGDRFADLLQSQYKNNNMPVIFINGGLAGVGPLEYTRMFLSVGLKYNPDALLIALHVNDVGNTFAYMKNDWIYNRISADIKVTGIEYFVTTYLPYLHTLIQTASDNYSSRMQRDTGDFLRTLEKEAIKHNVKQEEIDKWKSAAPEDLVEAVNRGAFDQTILGAALINPEYWKITLDIDDKMSNRKWDNMEMILSKLVNIARTNDIRVATILIPTRFQYEPDSHTQDNPQVKAGMHIRAEWLTETTEVQRRITAWAEKEQVPHLDLTPVFRKAYKPGRPLTFKLDGHWNKAGHAVAAKAISDWLTRDHVFDQ